MQVSAAAEFCMSLHAESANKQQTTKPDRPPYAGCAEARYVMACISMWRGHMAEAHDLCATLSEMGKAWVLVWCTELAFAHVRSVGNEYEGGCWLFITLRVIRNALAVACAGLCVSVCLFACSYRSLSHLRLPANHRTYGTARRHPLRPLRPHSRVQAAGDRWYV